MSAGREPSHLFALDDADASRDKGAWWVEGVCTWPTYADDTSAAIAVVGADTMLGAMERAQSLWLQAVDGTPIAVHLSEVRAIGTTMAREIPTAKAFFRTLAQTHGIESELVVLGQPAGASDRKAAAPKTSGATWHAEPARGVKQ